MFKRARANCAMQKQRAFLTEEFFRRKCSGLIPCRVSKKDYCAAENCGNARTAIGGQDEGKVRLDQGLRAGIGC